MRAFGMVSAWVLPVPIAMSAVSAQAADVRTARVQFPKGHSSATLSDVITGFESVEYRLSARAGQVMAVSLATSINATYCNVYRPGRGPGDEAIARSDVTDGVRAEPRAPGPAGEWRLPQAESMGSGRGTRSS